MKIFNTVESTKMRVTWHICIVSLYNIVLTSINFTNLPLLFKVPVLCSYQEWSFTVLSCSNSTSACSNANGTLHRYLNVNSNAYCRIRILFEMLSIAMQFSLRNVNYLTWQEPNKTNRTNSMAILVFSYKDKAKTKRKDHFPTIK